MAQMTRDQIVEAAQLEAGRDDSATLCNGWLQRWLDSIAATWQWPSNSREAAGIVLSAQTLDIGNSTGGIAENIIRILDNMWWYTPDRKSWGRVRVRSNLGSPMERIDTEARGSPESCRVLGLQAWGVKRLSFYPTPDRTYNLIVPYLALPPPIASGAEFPWYPNDETMIAAVVYKTHEYYRGLDDPKTAVAQQRLAALVLEDRVKYGHGPGQTDTLPLDPAVFPGAMQ